MLALIGLLEAQRWWATSHGTLHVLLVVKFVLLLTIWLVRLRQSVVGERGWLRLLDLAALAALLGWAVWGGWPRVGLTRHYVHPIGLGLIYAATVFALSWMIRWAAIEEGWLRRWLDRQGTRPPVVILASFLVLILGGMVLLILPLSTVDGHGMSPVDALFTATSASCVTGLAVYDTGSQLTLMGQLVILGLIQLGGLGIMVFSTFFLLRLGGMSLQQLHASKEFLGGSRPVPSDRLVRWIIFATLLTELIGAACLLPWMAEQGGGYGRGAYLALFHSISAFCNAGFALWGDSLTGMAGSSWCMLVMIGLIVAGGLGFNVYAELSAKVLRRSSDRLSLHTRLVLISTLGLLVVGALLFWLFEREGVLSGMGARDQLVHASFQSVTTRTAGFNTVEIGELSAPTLLMFYAWMLIGGSPGSTAGGLKTVTVLVLILSLVSVIRGREETVIFGRTLSQESIKRALLITVLAVVILFVFGLLMLATQEGRFEVILFEVVSAFGTVGLSAGYTSSLDGLGKLLIVVLMLFGRLGPLTVITALTRDTRPSRIQYAEERVAIG